eukprot:gene57640-78975_t
MPRGSGASTWRKMTLLPPVFEPGCGEILAWGREAPDSRRRYSASRSQPGRRSLGLIKIVVQWIQNGLGQNGTRIGVGDGEVRQLPQCTLATLVPWVDEFTRLGERDRQPRPVR